MLLTLIFALSVNASARTNPSIGTSLASDSTIMPVPTSVEASTFEPATSDLQSSSFPTQTVPTSVKASTFEPATSDLQSSSSPTHTDGTMESSVQTAGTSFPSPNFPSVSSPSPAFTLAPTSPSSLPSSLFRSDLPSFTATARAGEPTTLPSAMSNSPENACVTLSLHTGADSQHMSYSLYEYCAGSRFTDFRVHSQVCCLPEGIYTITCTDDSLGDGWQNALFFINDKRFCEDYSKGNGVKAEEVLIMQKDGQAVVYALDDGFIDEETSMDDYGDSTQEMECPPLAHKSDDGLCYCDSNHMLVTDSVFGCVNTETEIIGDVCGRSVVDMVIHVLRSSDVPACRDAEKEETNICECVQKENRFDWASASCKISPDMPTIADVYSLCMASTFQSGNSDVATSEIASSDIASSSRPATSDIFSSDIAATSEAETTEDIASSDFASSFKPITSDDIFSSEIASTSRPQCGNGICDIGEELSCPIDCMDEILDGMCDCIVSAGMCDATCDAIFQINSPQCLVYGAAGICGQVVDSRTSYRNICPDCSMETTQSDTLSTDVGEFVDFSMDDYTVGDIHSTEDLGADSTYVDGDTTFTNEDDATYFDDETSMDDNLDGNSCPKDSHRADDGFCYCDSNHMLVTDPVFGCDPNIIYSTFADDSIPDVTTAAEDSTVAVESTHSTTEVPDVTTVDKPEVSVDLQFLGLTQANFASKKSSIKLTLSRATGVPKKDISVTLVTSRRNRRMLQESSTVRAVFKTQAPTTVKESITKENLETLTEQSDDLQDIQLLAVSEPTISVPSTTESTEADATSTESIQTSSNSAGSSTTQRTATLPAQQGELANSQNQSGQTWPIFELAILGACFLTIVALLFALRSRCAKSSDEFKVMETLWKDENLSQNADYYWEGLPTPVDNGEFAQAEGSAATTHPTKSYIQEV